MPLLPNTTSTTPPRKEKSLDTTTATVVTPRPCPTPTQIEDVKTIQFHPIQLGDLLDKISYMKLNSVTTSNFCDDTTSISSLSVAASERDGEEDIFDDDSVSHEESTIHDEATRLKPSLKRCVDTFCFVPTIHRPSPPQAKRARLNYRH